ncbi:N-acetyltransferase family protein [Microbacterium sp. gxy059]|uniref:GNAT family N-acetyltransferase n=1 Tax=Microbacterium sp. gxy059 TaxID=2957199 RepID=UPI003D95764C
MPDSLVIREAAAGTADPTAISALAARTFPDACPAWLPEEEIRAFLAESLSPAQFSAWLSDADARVIVAEEGGTPVGYAVSLHGTHPEAPAGWEGERTAYLSKLYVDRRLRGGLGARLLAAAEETARADGCAAIWLGVNDENARALAFYERSGLARVGTRRFCVGGRLCSDEVRGRRLR